MQARCRNRNLFVKKLHSQKSNIRKIANYTVDILILARNKLWNYFWRPKIFVLVVLRAFLVIIINLALWFKIKGTIYKARLGANWSFWSRITRSNLFYSKKKLGAFLERNCKIKFKFSNCISSFFWIPSRDSKLKKQFFKKFLSPHIRRN